MKDATPKQACVMGWPIEHSLSPRIMGYWIAQYGLNATYNAMPVTLEQLKDAMQMLIDSDYAGCNLTIPLKEDAMALMDSHDDSALISGAVNTVVVRDGKLKGYNSDGFGFMESLKIQFPEWRGDKVVVVGTGGAARGVISALRAAGAQHFALVNRTPERAEKIVTGFGLNAEVFSWENRQQALAGATMLVNGSCLGMVGQPPLEIDLSTLPADAAVCDLVYRPLQTPLLMSARARGNPTVEGLGMLLNQARLGFREWFGQDPEVTLELYEDMRKAAA
ncbi:MAG: shikimate dehydrogenase [Alphaproteobacteria bacterium]|nr:shikimate dehydrogenase [Alphaproteobacteria bacterium]